ncbi:MAG: hypothetical protein P8Q14_01105, partial [Vicingaceae bacterium]|nr:hypothetical protein [Vicingaceae bacterium]
MIDLLKQWNDKHDIWSLFSDFIFVFGVLVLDWNPVFLILLFIIDTIVMLVFANILFYKEYFDFVKSIGFLLISFTMTSFLIAIYFIVCDNAEDHNIPSVKSLSEISYILPFILISSGLNHYTTYSNSIQKMKEGTYSSEFIKHVFLRYIFMILLSLL